MSKPRNILEIYNFDDHIEEPQQKKKDLGGGLIIQPNSRKQLQKNDLSINKKNSKSAAGPQKTLVSKMNQIKRVKQPKWIYFLTIVCILLTGIENIYIFLTRTTQLYVYLFVPTVALRMAISLICSYFLCKQPRLLFKLYFTIDKVFLTQVVEIVSVICYVSIFMPYTTIQWFYYFYEFSYPIMLFTSIGYIRVMLVFCNWKPWQVILFKISLMIGAISFFSIGIYYTVAAIDFTGGQNPQVDKLIKDIIFLYIFAGFELFNELFAKIDDIDGTATFKGGYKLQCDPQDMQLLLHGSREEKEKNDLLVSENQHQNIKKRSTFSQNSIISSKSGLGNKIRNSMKI